MFGVLIMLLNPEHLGPASRPQFALAPISSFSDSDVFSHFLKHSIPPHPLTAPVSIPQGWAWSLSQQLLPSYP